MSYPMTQPQAELLEILRRKHNIAPETMDALCERIFDTRYKRLSIRQATALITSLKDDVDAIKREIAVLAGQQSLFGEVPS